jgi:hypothetical protein
LSLSDLSILHELEASNDVVKVDEDEELVAGEVFEVVGEVSKYEVVFSGMESQSGTRAAAAAAATAAKVSIRAFKNWPLTCLV